MGFADMVSGVWDDVEAAFKSGGKRVREAVHAAREQFEKQVDDVWESPTEKSLKAENDRLRHELEGRRVTVDRFRREATSLREQRNIFAALLVAAVATAVLLLLL